VANKVVVDISLETEGIVPNHYQDFQLSTVCLKDVNGIQYIDLAFTFDDQGINNSNWSIFLPVD
jgi:hypothetical protein